MDLKLKIIATFWFILRQSAFQTKLLLRLLDLFVFEQFILIDSSQVPGCRI